MPKLILMALILSFGCLTGCDGNDAQTEQSATTHAGHAASPAADADQAFIDHMVPHHEMALMLADDALSKAGKPETKAFARQIKAAQTPEIAQLKLWRKQWYGSDQTPPMDHSEYQPMASGPDYDRKWTESMIQHHQQALDVSKQTLTTTTRPELKQLAQKVIDSQSKEITQLQAHLKALG